GGSFDVGASGEATYEMPLAVPAGPGGLAPSLAISYRSGSGDGILGEGFALAGLSELARCPKTRASAGSIDPIRFDANDDFCLDGKHLLLAKVSGTCSFYRTVPDTFVSVVGCGGLEGPDSFDVYTKDGVHTTYGGEASSRVLARALKADHTTHFTRAWLMSAVTKLGSVANIQYRYTNLTGLHGETREFAPKSITYGDTKLSFVTSTKPSPDRRFGYLYDGEDTDTLRLDHIDVSSSGTLVRWRKFDYALGPRTNRTLLSSTQECTTPAICGLATTFTYNSGAREAAFQWTKLDPHLPISEQMGASLMTMDVTGDGLDDIVTSEYGQNPDLTSDTQWFVDANHGGTGASFGPNQLAGIATGIHAATSIDYDQDGLQDLLMHDDVDTPSPTWHVARANRAAGNVVTFTSVDTHVHNWAATATYAISHLADLDGDGAMDLVQCHSWEGDPGYWTVNMWRSDLHGFDPTEIDLGVIGLAPTHVSFPCDVQVFPMDIDRDGRMELVMQEWRDDYVDGMTTYYDAIGMDANGMTLTQTSLPVPFDGSQPVFLDINGDGYPDAIEKRPATSHNLSLYINHGDLKLGEFSPTLDALDPATAPPVFDAWLQMAAPIDVNGDGRDDLVLPLKIDSFHRRWYILLARSDAQFGFTISGENLGFDLAITDEYNISSSYAPRVTDVDGDGVSDIVIRDLDHVFVFKNTNREEDTLATIREGLNARGTSDPKYVPDVALQYGHLIDTAITTDQSETDASSEARLYLSRSDSANTCQFPRLCAASSHRVVRHYELNNGADVKRNFDLRYRDGRLDLAGGGWLGFGRRFLIDTDTGTGTSDTYDNQTWLLGNGAALRYPYAGLVREERAWTPAKPTDPNPALVDVRISETFRETSFEALGPRTDQFSMPTFRRTRVFEGSWTSASGLTQWQWVKAADSSGAAELSNETTVMDRHDWDSFGNLRLSTTTNGGETTVVTKTFLNDDVSWIIGRTLTESTCSTVGTATKCKTDTRHYSPVGLVDTETVGSNDGLSTQVIKQFGYDAWGNAREEIDTDAFQPSRTTCTEYDAKGVFPAASRDPAGHVTYTATDPALGVRLALMDENGLITQWAYDAFGNVTRQVNPTGVSTMFTQQLVADPVRGAVIDTTAATSGGEQETIRHDEKGREVARWTTGVAPYCPGICPVAPKTVVYTEYDTFTPTVRRTSLSAVETATTFLWRTTDRDALGRPLLIHTPWTGGNTSVIY
ncbi:MAG: SpvB/TcaC N-terminal domain-containing protein, partial [Kofleriaceae bacterium]